MTFAEACSILGVARSASAEEIRAAYRRQLIAHHPDRSNEPDAEERAAQLALAYRQALKGETWAPTPAAPPTAPRSPNNIGEGAAILLSDADHRFFVEAPFDEAFRLILEVASQFGGIGYIDRHLGICEIMVRFEPGPTCSVMFTLEPATFGTEVSCVMESIEAAPTPDPSEFLAEFMAAFKTFQS